MKIEAYNESGDYRTGGLEGITVDEIVAVLGFKANCADDDSKVKYSWGFKADGAPCGIWDYKGSHRYNEFSTFGPDEVFRELFGDKYSK